MSTTRIEKQVEINAATAEVWRALTDFGNVYKLSPNIVKSYLTSDEPSGVGTTRHCDFAMMGASVEERIVEWKEGESLGIDIYERKKIPMISKMLADFRLSSTEGGGTLLTAGMEYEMSNAIGNFLNSVAMKKSNDRVWGEFLAGIKHYVETGEEVDKTTALNTTAVKDSELVS